MGKDSEWRTEKQRDERDRVNAKNLSLKEECCSRSDDQIERSEKIPRHRPLQSMWPVACHQQCDDWRQDSRKCIAHPRRPGESGRYDSTREKGVDEHATGEAVRLNGS